MRFYCQACSSFRSNLHRPSGYCIQCYHEFCRKTCIGCGTVHVKPYLSCSKVCHERPLDATKMGRTHDLMRYRCIQCGKGSGTMYRYLNGKVCSRVCRYLLQPSQATRLYWPTKILTRHSSPPQHQTVTPPKNSTVSSLVLDPVFVTDI